MRSRCLGAAFTFLIASAGWPLAASFAAEPAAAPAKGNSPVEIVADTIEYDSAKGLIIAQGSVVITRNTGVMTGARVEYNEKTRDSHMTGGVKAVDGDMTLTAAEVRSRNDTDMVATGDVVLVKGTSTLTGPVVEYYSERQYARVPRDGRVETADGTMTADLIEAFLDRESAVGVGHVHVVSPPRQLDATADEGVYYGQPKGQSKVILTGHARALQEGNLLTGETMTIRLDDKAMDSQGRSRLVVIPK